MLMHVHAVWDNPSIVHVSVIKVTRKNAMTHVQSTLLKANTDDCDKGGTPGATSSNFHVPLHLILIAGTCAVLIASKLSNI